MKNSNLIKTGQNVYFNNIQHLFLGYIDPKFKRAIITDKHGNKIEVWSENLTLNK